MMSRHEIGCPNRVKTGSTSPAIQARVAIQGALDPVVLRSGGKALDAAIDGILQAWGKGPLIFNLGHGIFPDTPIAHVEQALKRIRGQ